MADTVYWNMSRPQETVEFYMVNISNPFKDAVLSVNYTIVQGEYLENHPGIDGLDGLWSVILVNATVNEGFLEMIAINFSDIDAHAALDIPLDYTDFVKLVNLKVSYLDHNHFGKNSYIKAESIGQPSDVYFHLTTFWFFIDQNNQDHWMNATLELIYHTNATRFRVIIPIKLGVLIP
jgi:hypothetical protein